MATLWKKTNSVNYYYKFMYKGETYQATTGKSNKAQAQRTANKIEAEIRQSFAWQVAYERLQKALDFLSAAEQLEIRRNIAQELLTFTGQTLLIKDAFGRWLELPKTRSQTKRTLADYSSIWSGFQNYISNTYGDIKSMHEITKSIAGKYMTSIWDNNVSEGTYNKKLTVLSGLFRSLKEDIGLPENPFKTIPKKQKYTISRVPFTSAEIKKLLEAATDEYKTLIYLGAFLGTRLGDAVNIRWSNIDFEANLIRYTPTKTESYQRKIEIPIFPQLLDYLQTLPRNNNQLTPTLKSDYENNAPKISKNFNKIVKSIGLETSKKRKDGRGRKSSIYGYHSLRHSFISTCKNQGVPQHFVMAWVAHSTEAVSAIYTHIDGDSSQKYITNMGNII